MPTPPQATVDWQGVNITTGFTFAFQPMGIEPSTCVIKSPPHSTGLAAQGPLTLRYGGGSLVFNECRLERPRLSLGNVDIWDLPIMDRRWKWRYGSISGAYNVRQPDGSLLREKTPRELAELLLDAMGEEGYDVNALPNDARPERFWRYSNPAQELQALCSLLGCVIVYDPFPDRVMIRIKGQAGQLPAGDTIGGGVGFDAPASPDEIVAAADPTLFQGEFALEAVGEDTDGKIVPVDDLSYKPAGGWGGVDPHGQFTSITGTYTRGGKILQKRDLARRSLWRMYRITGLVDGSWSPPLLKKTDLEPQGVDDLRFLGTLAEESQQVDGSFKRMPAELSGTWTLTDPAAQDMSNGGVFTDGFSIDGSAGVVTLHCVSRCSPLS